MPSWNKEYFGLATVAAIKQSNTVIARSMAKAKVMELLTLPSRWKRGGHKTSLLSALGIRQF